MEVPSIAADLPILKGYSTESDGDPKNLILSWLDEMGIAGGVLFVLFLTTIARTTACTRTTASVAVTAAWLGLFIFGIFATPFGMASHSYGNALLGALLGLTLLLRDQSTSRPSEVELLCETKNHV